MQPFSPPKYCRKCRTELVKDSYNQTVHLETAQTQCPILFTPISVGYTALQKCSRCRALVENTDKDKKAHANYHRETGSM